MLNDAKWQVRFERPPYMAGVKMWMWRPNADGAEVLGPDGMLTRIRNGAVMSGIKPVLELNFVDAKEIMSALAAALEEDGVRTPDSHRLLGIIEAQNKHIADLREMLKLKNTGGTKNV